MAQITRLNVSFGPICVVFLSSCLNIVIKKIVSIHKTQYIFKKNILMAQTTRLNMLFGPICIVFPS